MALVTLTVFGLASVIVTASLTLISGWDLGAEGACPGSSSFCASVWWTAAVDYLPIWLFMGQVLVVIAMAGPAALIRIDR